MAKVGSGECGRGLARPQTWGELWKAARTNLRRWETSAFSSSTSGSRAGGGLLLVSRSCRLRRPHGTEHGTERSRTGPFKPPPQQERIHRHLHQMLSAPATFPRRHANNHRGAARMDPSSFQTRSWASSLSNMDTNPTERRGRALRPAIWLLLGNRLRAELRQLKTVRLYLQALGTPGYSFRHRL